MAMKSWKSWDVNSWSDARKIGVFGGVMLCFILATWGTSSLGRWIINIDRPYTVAPGFVLILLSLACEVTMIWTLLRHALWPLLTEICDMIRSRRTIARHEKEFDK